MHSLNLIDSDEVLLEVSCVLKLPVQTKAIVGSIDERYLLVGASGSAAEHSGFCAGVKR